MLTFRPVNHHDWNSLFVWRNDAETVQMSVNNRKVSVSEHAAWFKKRKGGGDFWIVKVGRSKVGMIRVDDGELSYIVSPKFRGMGIGSKMLAWAYKKYGPLTARIKRENVASIKVAKRAGHKVVLI